MLTGILGEKIAMSQRFGKDGKVQPVTEIKAGPVTVVQVKTKNKDGYTAVKLAYGAKKKGKKPILGQLKKAGVNFVPRILAEVRLTNGELPQEGEEFTVDQIFQPGELVKISGVSKGKGFTGVMKRWGFAGGPATHGQTDRLRAPGSIGQTTTPGRVFRGKKMAGRKGSAKVTIYNLQVIEVNRTKNILVLSGSVPGSPKSILKIEKIGQAKRPFEPFVKEVKKEEGENPPSREAGEGKENAENNKQ